jgi:hypothetical protein
VDGRGLPPFVARRNLPERKIVLSRETPVACGRFLSLLTSQPTFSTPEPINVLHGIMHFYKHYHTENMTLTLLIAIRGFLYTLSYESSSFPLGGKP